MIIELWSTNILLTYILTRSEWTVSKQKLTFDCVYCRRIVKIWIECMNAFNSNVYYRSLNVGNYNTVCRTFSTFISKCIIAECKAVVPSLPTVIIIMSTPNICLRHLKHRIALTLIFTLTCLWLFNFINQSLINARW